MKRTITTLFIALGLVLAACGGDSTPVATGGEDDGVGDEPGQAEPDADREPSTEEPAAVETLITDGDAVDPRVTAPSEVLLNPADPTELWVRFVGGDPNCTAASATLLTETPDALAIELLVGITQDALARSCMAGEFNLRVDVALNESGEGKSISWVPPAADEAPVVTPDLSTDDFIGLTEEEAAAIAEENIIPWRIGRIDGDSFPLTEDFNPGRLTFQIDDGIITSATLG